jgi:hypothetical protein
VAIPQSPAANSFMPQSIPFAQRPEVSGTRPS